MPFCGFDFDMRTAHVINTHYNRHTKECSQYAQRAKNEAYGIVVGCCCCWHGDKNLSVSDVEWGLGGINRQNLNRQQTKMDLFLSLTTDLFTFTNSFTFRSVSFLF